MELGHETLSKTTVSNDSANGIPHRVGLVLVPIGLFLLALMVRALPWASVLTPKHVYFFGHDAYYHMRRILYALENFPAFLNFDSYINFPHGAKPIWTPFFDATVACLLRPFYHAGDVQMIERMVVWVPPFLGAGTVLVLYFLAKRHFGFHVAWVSALLLSVLSAHYWYSQVGFVDHHAAVALVSTLLLAAVMELFRRLSNTEIQNAPDPESTVISTAMRSKSLLASAAATGLLLGGLLLLWPGGLIFAALVEGAFMVYLISRRTAVDAARFAGLSVLIYAIAFILVFPFSYHNTWPQWNAFSPVVLSRFQPWMFAMLMIHGVACALLWRWAPSGRIQRRRLLQAVGIGVIIIAISILAIPEIRIGLADAWRWLFKNEAFQQMVNESKPIFHNGPRVAELRLSRFIYVFPIALATLWICARRQHVVPTVLLLIGWSLVLAIVTLLQKRFMNSFSVAFALVIGWNCVHAFKLRPQSWRCSSAKTAAAVAIFTGIIAFFLWPVFGAYNQPVQTMTRRLQKIAFRIPNFLHYRAAQWLRENTPPTSGFLDTSRTPEYAILSTWSQGHLLEYVARRPTVVDNFGDDLGGDNFEQSLAYFKSSEQEAVKIAEQLGVRYIMTTLFVTNEDVQSMAYRFYHNGSGFHHHRLVYMTPKSPGVDNQAPPMVKIFEYVKGARLVGHAPVGQEVKARLNYHFGGRKGVFMTSAVADASGRYALQLPYATRGAPPGIKTDYHMRVEAEGRVEHVIIDEQAVRKGEQVEGPDFTH